LMTSPEDAGEMRAAPRRREEAEARDEQR
jgi:hypothetical protein